MSALLDVRDLSVRLGGRAVLRGASLRVAPGECVGLLGPNGAGKTTLMRAALGLVPHGGTSSLAALPPLARARRAAWLPQSREVAWPVRVRDLVALGRHPHPGDRGADARAVARALERMALGPFADRDATRLSGGEQARALLARALAQETPLILADEPVAGLDPAGQIATMALFAALAAEGRAVLVSLHDLGLALRRCTRLALMDGGRIVADGPPREVLTPARLREVFGIRAHLAETADGPVLAPLEAA